ncbi:MAG: cellulase family glycosylhydrolase [Lachnospiraceae bacterium]|nr:cellulase family glycosylhydrolase [Lachnospiraceae bacterium]
MGKISEKIKFIKGMDVSTLLELEALGAKFQDADGDERDVLSILQEYGTNAIRIRLWNHPYSQEGEPYGGGTNDMDSVITLAKRVRERGMYILLDVHYSDFWADPGKQIKPKAWADFTGKRLEYAVYDYTLAMLRNFRTEGVFPDMIQVGNELSNGLLWPDGKRPNYENIAWFVSAGIRAVRAVDQDMPIMIHLDNGGNNALYREWFDSYFENDGLDFDIIGLSYYPFWHGSMKDLENNMRDLAERYGKELIVAEVSMGYTMEDYAKYENLKQGERKGMATKPSLVKKVEYPMTKKGQADFMEDLMKRIARVPKGLGRGFFYWEPAWIPVPGSGWATEASLKYMKDPGPCGNEWANQALFDYDGRPLPALDVIKKFKG